MNAKSSITSLTHELERMPRHIADARKTVDGWRGQLLRTVRRYPGRSILGAFAIGVVLTRLARHA